MKEIAEDEMEELNKEQPIDENDDIIHMWEPLQFKINEKYKYVRKDIPFKILSYLFYYGVAVPIIYILTKAIYDLKIEGKENIVALKSGAVTVSNHVLFLDCAMVRSCLWR